MPQLRILLLGYPQIQLGKDSVSLETRKAHALLAYLAIENRAHSRETLATMFWPEYEPARAFHNLRRILWAIQKAIGKEWLETERDSLKLIRDDDLFVDVLAFQKYLHRSSLHGHVEREACSDCVPYLQKAIELYKDEFLQGFSLPDSPAFEEWVFFTREEIKQQAVQILESLVHTFSAEGDFTTALNYAQRWLSMLPFHEPALQTIMLLYESTGQRAYALHQYEQFTQALSTELGIEPSEESLAIYKRIRTGRDLPTDRAPLSPMSPADTSGDPPILEIGSPPSNLPHNLTPFVGRRPELEEIKARLLNPDVRLLTLMGPGGIGKTRLAIQAARETIGNFRSGVYFIYLAPLTSPDAVLPAILKVLKLQTNPGGDSPLQQLCAYLRDKQILFILDNFEHLIEEESIQVVLSLLAETPEVKILVTSRSRLNLHSEHIIPVAGMRLPEESQSWQERQELDDYSGLQLFIQSAMRVRPDFELTHENYRHVVGICQAVAGMPLGIELAAAWLELLSIHEIYSELTRNLDFLETTQQDVPERQRSLRAVFEISWNRLAETDRNLFPQLTIFSGGFTRQAAQEITGVSLVGLSSLVNKSFLYRLPNGRYEIHELLRQYGEAELRKDRNAWEAARSRHSKFYLTYIEQHGLEIFSPTIREVLNRLDDDLENIRSAWNWAITKEQFDDIDQALFGLFAYFELRDFYKGLPDYLERTANALERSLNTRSARLLLAKVLAILSAVTYDTITDRTVGMLDRGLKIIEELGAEREAGIFFTVLAREFCGRINPEKGIELLRRSLEWLRAENNHLLVSFGLHSLAISLFILEEFKEGRQLIEEAMAIDRQHGNLIGLADNQSALAGVCYRERNMEEAERLLNESAKTYAYLGDRARQAMVILNLGSYMDSAGEFKKSIQYYQQLSKIDIELGNSIGLAIALSWESIATLRMGDIDRARQLRLQSIDLGRKENSPTDIVWGLLELGEIERVAGNLDLAEQYLNQSVALHPDTPMSGLLAFYNKSMGYLFLDRGEGENALQHFQQSRYYAHRDYNRWCGAYTTSGMGDAYLALGNKRKAIGYLLISLRAADDLANHSLMTIPMTSLTHWMAAQGNYEKAVELGTMLLAEPATWYEMREKLSDLIGECAKHLPGRIFSEARTRGSRQPLEPAIQDLLAKMENLEHFETDTQDPSAGVVPPQ